MSVIVPANPYWANLEFHSEFNLLTGKLTVDLTGSTFAPGTGVYATVQVKFPNGQSPVITLNLPTDKAVMDIPKLLNGIYWWGNYTITVTAYWPGSGSQALAKEFSLTPPDCVGESNEAKGTLQITVDCQDGALVGRGFSGYAYKGKMPASEQYDITRYYPAEAGLLPQAGITMVPFEVDAWEGDNLFKGTNTSRYDLDDGFTVVMRINAEAKKKVHCSIDYSKLWAGVQEVLKNLRSCDATQQKNISLGEINALLWVVTAGTAEGKNMGDEVERLEQLLGIDCNCAALSGTQVVPGQCAGCACPAVRNLQATYNADEGTVDISVDTSGIDTSFKLRVAYKNVCNPENLGDHIISTGDYEVTGGVQTISVPVPMEAMYEMSVAVVRSDGVTCVPEVTSTNNVDACGVVIDSDDSVIVDADGSTAILYD
jgi:hypothetical protein